MENKDDKILIFGGWKPYLNLSEIELFDMKNFKMLDITKLKSALVQDKDNFSIPTYAPVNNMSATTAHESNVSSEES